MIYRLAVVYTLLGSICIMLYASYVGHIALGH